MNDNIIEAFSNELEKVAFFGAIGRGAAKVFGAPTKSMARLKQGFSSQSAKTKEEAAKILKHKGRMESLGGTIKDQGSKIEKLEEAAKAVPGKLKWATGKGVVMGAAGGAAAVGTGLLAKDYSEKKKKAAIADQLLSYYKTKGRQ